MKAVLKQSANIPTIPTPLFNLFDNIIHTPGLQSNTYLDSYHRPGLAYINISNEESTKIIIYINTVLKEDKRSKGDVRVKETGGLPQTQIFQLQYLYNLIVFVKTF